MRARRFIRKCPDGCGKDEYDLGLYRGFHLYQKPFYDGWYVYAELEHPKDELDTLLLKEFEGLSGKICLDTETSEHFTVEKCEQYIIETIDKFWDKKQRLTKDKEKFVLTGKIYDPVLDCGHAAMNIESPEDYINTDIQSALLEFEGKKVRITIEELREHPEEN